MPDLDTEINLEAARAIYQLFYENVFQNQLNEINAKALANNQILVNYTPDAHKLWHLRPDHYKNIHQDDGDIHNIIMKIMSIIPIDVILKWAKARNDIEEERNALKWKMYQQVSDNYSKIHLKQIAYVLANYPELEIFITEYFNSI